MPIGDAVLPGGVVFGGASGIGVSIGQNILGSPPVALDTGQGFKFLEERIRMSLGISALPDFSHLNLDYGGHVAAAQAAEIAAQQHAAEVAIRPSRYCF